MKVPQETQELIPISQQNLRADRPLKGLSKRVLIHNAEDFPRGNRSYAIGEILTKGTNQKLEASARPIENLRKWLEGPSVCPDYSGYFDLQE